MSESLDAADSEATDSDANRTVSTHTRPNGRSSPATTSQSTSPSTVETGGYGRRSRAEYAEEDTTGVTPDGRTGMADDPASRSDDPLEPGASNESERTGLAARVQLLEFENARLRRERVRTTERRHRRGALGFLALGVLSAGAGYALPESRTLLFSLAGIGLFSAVLTYYLTGSNLISVSTIERVYLAHAETLAEVVSELGLQDVGVYVPTASGSEREGLSNVRLFVPQQAEYELPDDLASVFVVTDDGRRRGVAVHPVGSALFATFAESLRDPLAEAPDELAAQLAVALLEEFELVSEATPEYDPTNHRITVRVRDSALGPVDRFDHPVASFVATGLAHGLGRPIRTEVHHRDDDVALVVCSWDDTETADEAEETEADWDEDSDVPTDGDASVGTDSERNVDDTETSEGPAVEADGDGRR